MYHLDSLLKDRKVDQSNTISRYRIEGVFLWFDYKGYDGYIGLYHEDNIEKLKLSSLRIFKLLLTDLYNNNIPIKIYTPRLSEFIHIVHRWGYILIPISNNCEFKVDKRIVYIADVYDEDWG